MLSTKINYGQATATGMILIVIFQGMSVSGSRGIFRDPNSLIPSDIFPTD
jgi:hypothetical protein